MRKRIDAKFTNMNFELLVEGKKLSCKSFHNFEQEVEYDSISEGGLNDRVHIRPKPVSKPFTFQVERYVGPGYQDPLMVGKVLEHPIELDVSTNICNFQDADARFFFSGCVVTGKSYSEMDAEKSGLIVETTTVAYESLSVEWKEAQKC